MSYATRLRRFGGISWRRRSGDDGRWRLFFLAA